MKENLLKKFMEKKNLYDERNLGMEETLTDIDATEIVDRDCLAMVGRVKHLTPIEGKDRVELMTIQESGFSFVCEKIHKVGDLVVYVKYDTVVPDNELFAFMAATKFRVKAKCFTHKDSDDNVVGKTYSQGIVLPIIKTANFLYSTLGLDDVYKEGKDLTESLGVRKYIPPVSSGAGSSFGNMLKKGDFPTHLLSKSDEDNLASRTRALEELDGKSVYVTLKSEGSSLSCFLDPETLELNVCTRNNNLKEVEGSKFWEAVNKYNLKEKLKKYPNFAIQAELVGPKIQANHHTLTEVDMHVFNIIDIANDRRRLSYNEMIPIINDLGLTMVKLVRQYFNFTYTEDSFNELQEFADKCLYDNGTLAEGIVIRPYEPFVSQKLRTIWSGKIINRNYKL